MSQAVLISIRPKWCSLIASGKKTLEIRKTRPKLKPPFKCYIYETKGKVERARGEEDGYHYQEGRSAVIGEFTCDQIEEIAVAFRGGDGPMVAIGGNQVWYGGLVQHMSCLTTKDICKYIGGIGRRGFGWHISSLIVYDRPKKLSEFKQCHKCEYHKNCFEHEYSCDGAYALNRPPQSWCYVEELT